MKKELCYLWNLPPSQDACPEDTNHSPRPGARPILFQNGPSGQKAADAILELISHHLSSSNPDTQSGGGR